MMLSKASSEKNSSGIKTIPSLEGGLLGHLAGLGKSPLDFLAQIRKEHGDIVQWRLFFQKIVLLSEPRYVHHVLVTNQSNYRKASRGYQKMRLALGNGLVTSEGEFWRRQRRIAQPAFHRRRIEGFAGVMRSMTESLVEKWRSLGENSSTIEMNDAMMKLTLGIAGETLFSQDISQDSDAFGKELQILLERFVHLVAAPYPFPEYLPTLANFRGHRAIYRLSKMIYAIIEQRRKEGVVKDDLLSMFMEAQDEETGERMTDRQLRDEALTMLAAGHETTANALTWTLYLLAKHPEVARRLEAEVDEVLERSDFTLESLNSFPFLQQVLQESMRLYPPVWALARKAREDDVIDGYPIQKGTLILMSFHTIHRHPGLWDEPDTFDPDRFSPERLEAKKALGRSKNAYLPFSLGKRKCIGDHFAKMEAQIILAILVRHFRFSEVEGFAPVLQPSVTLRPKTGLPLVVSLRS